uniref:Uncharacterized protein n=1 Tax=Panagrolaimus superbus TaxID=310955 RepID=A0A914YNP6_9BILA
MKTVEPTQDETPTNDQTIEPTVEDATNPSIVQHAAPTVTVSKEPIQSSRPYGFMRRSESSKSGKTDSLSGRHDGEMNGMVVNPLRALKGRNPKLNVAEMEKFYPADDKTLLPRPDPREIQLLCCRISVMLKLVEELVKDAEETLKKIGVQFDANGFIAELPQKALNYLTVGNCPEFIRYFAFGNLFRAEIDSSLGKEPTLSIPLLFVIIYQRRYPAENRRKACAWIR